jgi:hypothetical protein
MPPKARVKQSPEPREQTGMRDVTYRVASGIRPKAEFEAHDRAAIRHERDVGTTELAALESAHAGMRGADPRANLLLTESRGNSRTPDLTGDPAEALVAPTPRSVDPAVADSHLAIVSGGPSLALNRAIPNAGRS